MDGLGQDVALALIVGVFWAAAGGIYVLLKNKHTGVRVVAAGVGGFATIYAFMGVFLLLASMFGWDF